LSQNITDSKQLVEAIQIQNIYKTKPMEEVCSRPCVINTTFRSSVNAVWIHRDVQSE
jgi:hypothetical protein